MRQCYNTGRCKGNGHADGGGVAGCGDSNGKVVVTVGGDRGGGNGDGVVAVGGDSFGGGDGT